MSDYYDEVSTYLSYTSSDCFRNEWVTFLCAIKEILGDSGYETARTWSMKSQTKFKERDFNSTWKSITIRGEKEKSLNFLKKKANIPRPVKSEHGFTTKEESSLSQSGRTVSDSSESSSHTPNQPITSVEKIQNSTSDDEKRANVSKQWHSFPLYNAANHHPYLIKKELTDKLNGYEVNLRTGYSKIKLEDDQILGHFFAYPLLDLETFEIVGFNRISESGKMLGKDSRKAGNAGIIGILDKSTAIVCICEGLADGLHIRHASKHTTLVANDAGNIANVAKRVRKIYPQCKIVICADHDDAGRDGAEKATKNLTNTVIVYPANKDFSDDVLAGLNISESIQKAIDTVSKEETTTKKEFNLKFIPTDQHGFNADLERAIKSGQSEETICKELQEKHPTIEGIDIRVARAIARTIKKAPLSDEVKKAFSEQYRDYVIGSTTIEEIAKKFEIPELLNGMTNIVPQFLNYCEKRKFASNSDRLDLTGLTTRKNNCRFIEIPTPSDNDATYIIKSPMGTGKTVFLSGISDAYLKQNCTIAYVCHRVSLSQNASKVLKFEHYQDKTKMSKNNRKKYETQQTDIPVQSISIVVNSIPGFKGFKGNTPDVVLIDEIDQVLKHITGGACKNGAEVLESLQEWVREAKFVAVLSADIDQRSIEFVKSLRGNKPIQFFENTYQPRKGQEITLVRKPENIYERITATLLSQKDGCAVVATNSFNESVAVEKYLKEKFPTKRIRAINSDCSQNDETREFIANINNEMKKLDCLIYSPSIGSGVSIDYPNISGVFGIFYATSGGTPSDAWQQIGRVRKLDVPTYLYVENRRQFDLPITEDEVWEQYAKKFDAQEKQFERSEKDWTGCAIRQVFYTYQLSQFDSLSVTNTITINKANQDFKLNFILEGERKGIKFRFESEKSPEFKQARAEIASVIKEEYRQAVFDADDLSGKELSNLERKKELGLSFNRDEKMSLEKLDIKKVFAPKNDSELERAIELDNNGKGRHIINRIRAIAQPIEEIARPDRDLIRTLVDEKRLSNITNHRTALLDRELVQRLFNATGITLTENGLISDGRSFDAHSPEITSFCQWVSNTGIEPERKVNSISKNPIKYIGDQLRTLNINLKRHSKGRDLKIYTINLDDFKYNTYLSCDDETHNICIRETHADPIFLKKNEKPCVYQREKEEDQYLEFCDGEIRTDEQIDFVKTDNVAADGCDSEDGCDSDIPSTIFHDDVVFWYEKTEGLSQAYRKKLARDYEYVLSKEGRRQANLMVIDAVEGVLVA